MVIIILHMKKLGNRKMCKCVCKRDRVTVLNIYIFSLRIIQGYFATARINLKSFKKAYCYTCMCLLEVLKLAMPYAEKGFNIFLLSYV